MKQYKFCWRDGEASTYCPRRDMNRPGRGHQLHGTPGCLQTAAGSHPGCSGWRSRCQGSAPCSCCWTGAGRSGSSTKSWSGGRARGSACRWLSGWSRCAGRDPEGRSLRHLGGLHMHKKNILMCFYFSSERRIHQHRTPDKDTLITGLAGYQGQYTAFLWMLVLVFFVSESQFINLMEHPLSVVTLNAQPTPAHQHWILRICKVTKVITLL